MGLFDVEPVSFDQALRRAVAEDPELAGDSPDGPQ